MRIFCLAWVLVWSAMPAMSADIEGRIKGDKFNWISAQPYSSYYVSSVWDLPLHLPAAARVVPGGATQNGAEITLTNTGTGESVQLPLIIEGVSYRLPNIVSSQPYRGSDGTATSDPTGMGVDVIGSGIGSVVFDLGPSQTPFTHHRPLFEMDKDRWKTSMKGKPSGTYRGALNYTIKYNYYRNGIIVRNTLQASLVVTLKYEPLNLISVEITQGDGFISPVYAGFPVRKVSGNTMYTIEARGVVPNGVQIKLQPVKGVGQFQLDSLSGADDSFITYSVKCAVGCDRQEIITDGSPNYEPFIMAKDNYNYNVTTHNAFLSVALTETALSELVSGKYQGSFTLVFQAAM